MTETNRLGGAPNAASEAFGEAANIVAEPAPVIVVAGRAGSGKTTLGRALARRLRLPILDLDSLTNPLLDAMADVERGGRHWLDGDDPVVRAGRYAVLGAAASDLLAVGSGAVLVAPFTAELQGGPAWSRLRDAVAPARMAVVFLDGQDELFRRRRAARGASRDAYRTGSDPQAAPPLVPHIRVDATLTTAQQTFRVARALGHRTLLDLSSPVFEKEYDAVLFDLDGTLVDSTPVVGRIWAQLADEYGFDPLAGQQNHGRPALDLIRQVLPAHRVAEAHARVSELETADTADVTPIVGADELLRAVPTRASAIVTSGETAVATARIAAARLPPVGVLVTADDVDRPKPDPQPFLLAAERLGVAASRCLVFEDSSAGAVAATRAGCTVIGVGGTCSPDELDVALWLDGLDRVRLVEQEAGLRLIPRELT